MSQMKVWRGESKRHATAIREWRAHNWGAGVSFPNCGTSGRWLEDGCPRTQHSQHGSLQPGDYPGQAMDVLLY